MLPILVILSMLVVVFIGGCDSLYKPRMLKYYSDDSNYEEVEAVVKEIMETSSIKLDRDTEKYSKSYQDTYQFLIFDNDELEKSGFLDEAREGDTITIITASGIFYDGYYLPIVGISSNGKTYSNFESGKKPF